MVLCRSAVWNHFDRDVNAQLGTCIHCRRTIKLSKTASTWKFLNHLKRHHNDLFTANESLMFPGLPVMAAPIPSIARKQTNEVNTEAEVVIHEHEDVKPEIGETNIVCADDILDLIEKFKKEDSPSTSNEPDSSNIEQGDDSPKNELIRPVRYFMIPPPMEFKTTYEKCYFTEKEASVFLEGRTVKVVFERKASTTCETSCNLSYTTDLPGDIDIDTIHFEWTDKQLVLTARRFSDK